jgi:arsenate reductase
MSKRKVLFLCTGNSCRSQMAEAIVNARMSESWEARSAGFNPSGNVHPKSLSVLEEIGIVHHGKSKSIDEFRGSDFDLVITLCDASAEACPVWLGGGKKVHFSFPDPGNTNDIDDFRKVRDDIAREIISLLKEFTL